MPFNSRPECLKIAAVLPRAKTNASQSFSMKSSSRSIAFAQSWLSEDACRTAARNSLEAHLRVADTSFSPH
jgi:hypothetical protein